MTTHVGPKDMESRLVFLVGAPRSGTTLLMRILAGHTAIYSRPEPHLLPPLAHLGYYDTVDAAPFDHLQAAGALRAFVADLPRGEADFLDACRAYSDLLYGRLLAARAAGKRFFLDKTPANALILPFVTRLYPAAHYVVLTRHPAAVFCSYANSFFDGDFEAARRFNPILSRYVPAIARLLRDRPVPLVHVRYEELVGEPDPHVRRVCAFIGLPFEPGAIEYGNHPLDASGLGDPTGVNRHRRPVADSAGAWAAELAASPAKLRIVREMVDGIDDADLETWGCPRAAFFAPVEAAAAGARLPRPRAARFDRFLLQRKLLLRLRRNIRTNAFGRVVRRVRELCDVLLRG